MEYQLFTGKNVDDAITKALVALGVTSDKLDYEIVEKGSNGILGIGSKPAKINARVKEEEVQTVATSEDVEKIVKDFLAKVFDATNLTVKINVIVVERLM